MTPELLNSFSAVWKSSTRAQKEATRTMSATVDLLTILNEFSTDVSEIDSIVAVSDECELDSEL